MTTSQWSVFVCVCPCVCVHVFVCTVRWAIVRNVRAKVQTTEDKQGQLSRVCVRFLSLNTDWRPLWDCRHYESAWACVCLWTGKGQRDGHSGERPVWQTQWMFGYTCNVTGEGSRTRESLHHSWWMGWSMLGREEKGRSELSLGYITTLKTLFLDLPQINIHKGGHVGHSFIYSLFYAWFSASWFSNVAVS